MSRSSEWSGAVALYVHGLSKRFGDRVVGVR
jgi:hypothetical protein